MIPVMREIPDGALVSYAKDDPDLCGDIGTARPWPSLDGWYVAKWSSGLVFIHHRTDLSLAGFSS